MLKKEKLKRVNFNVEPTKWEDFKVICKFIQSDSNKELRKFIDEFLNTHKSLQNKLRSEEENS
ncbi:hypothetical protein [Aliarcobacter butzleri]|uniref:hypothetical protein n=1 Tax=Aliarcobacter butzleri TaxID=28197 RepID=UPI003AF56E04